MASPQCENGYTRFANELLDAICALRIGGQELRVVLYVARQTYGYGKKSDQISYGQIARATKIPRTRVIEHVKNLVSKMVLGSHNNGTRKPITIWIHKDYTKWMDSPKKGTSPNNETTSSPNNGYKPSPNNGTHKRKKERKEIPSDFLEFSKRFHVYRKEQLGDKLVKVTEKKIQDGAEVIEKLVRLDGYSLEDDIRPALLWAVDDHFWSSQVRSLAGLRKKMSNGELKFSNLYAKYIASKPKQKVVEEVW